MAEPHTKRATTLSSVSGLIIVFLLSGANLNDRGSLFGGSFDYEHKVVLEWAAFLFLNFSLIRFMASSRTPLGKLQEKFCIPTRNNFGELRQEVENEIAAQLSSLDQTQKRTLFAVPDTTSVDKIETPTWPHYNRSDRENGAFRVAWFRAEARVKMYLKTPQDQTEATGFLYHRVPYGVVWKVRSRAFFDVVLLSDDFWELLVPYVLYLAALGLMFIAWLGIPPDGLLFPEEPVPSGEG